MSADRVVVVGGGLAGISAAVGLADAGLPVTLLEARPWLGGATWSFGRRGLTIDNGQHVFLRCFTAYRDLLERLGVAELAPVQHRLDLAVLGQDRAHRVRRSGLPAPLHLAVMLARYRPLRWRERAEVVPAALAMWLTDLSGSGHDSLSIGDWLAQHGQTERARRQFWDTFLVPALNAASDQADLGTAGRFINAALLSRRDHSDIGIASVPAHDLHGGPAGRLLATLGVQVRLSSAVTAIRRDPDGDYSLRLQRGAAEEPPGQLAFGAEDSDLIKAAGVVLAVPAWVATELVPPELASTAARWARLEPSPVVSAHVIYDRKITELPFATTVGSPLRWITDKTTAAGLHTGQYLAVSLPAARQIVDAPAASIKEKVLPELARLLPAAAAACPEDFFVTRERRATFLAVPGSAAFRPSQVTELRAFALAGAWTDTGWPDSMEGAVLSGRRAAQSVMGALIARAAHRQAEPERNVGASAPAVTKVPAAREPADARPATEEQTVAAARGTANRAEPAVRQ